MSSNVMVKKLTEDPEYDKLVFEACSMVKATADVILMFYWDLGRVVRQATSGAEDGPRSVPQFLKHMALAKPGKISLQSDSIYNALQMHAAFTLPQIKIMQEAEIPLNAALTAASKKVSKEQRDAIVKQLAAGQLDPKKFTEAVQSAPAAKGIKSPAESGAESKRGSTIKVMRFPMLIEAMSGKMEGYADAMDVLCSAATDDDEIDKIQKAFREACESMDSAIKRWEAQQKLAKKVLDKTITTLSREERKGGKKK